MEEVEGIGERLGMPLRRRGHSVVPYKRRELRDTVLLEEFPLLPLGRRRVLNSATLLTGLVMRIHRAQEQ